MSLALAKTDQNGAFEFNKVTPGTYRASVQTPKSPALWARNNTDSSIPETVITISAGENVDHVRLELTATASISGRIVDTGGKPVSDLTVTAISPAYTNGHRVLSTLTLLNQATVARTNARGEYRIDGLTPGQYYVAANGFQTRTTLVSLPSWCASNLGTAWSSGLFQTGGGGYGGGSIDLTQTASVAETRQPSSKTFYPGVQDPTEARPIDVHLGAERDHVDFKIGSTADVGIAELRGTVVDSATEKRMQQASVWITPVDGGAQSCLIETKDGTFKSAGVPPGKYVVSANLNNSPLEMAGRVILDTNSKQNNITIPVAPLPHLRGRIVVEGEATATDFDLSRYTVNLKPDPDMDNARLSFAPVSRDGTFEIAGVMGWDYRVSLRSPESNTYIQSIRLGTEDVLSGGLHLANRSNGELEIVIRRNAGTVTGVAPEISNRQGRVQNVVLVPDPAHRNRQDLYRTAQLNENGEFEMRGLAPGDYHIFAWEKATPGSWTDPEFLRLYETQGTPIQVLPGIAVEATVKAIAPWK